MGVGCEKIAQDVSKAGVDGLLKVDLPPLEANDFLVHLKAHELDAIFLVAPTSTGDRIDKICNFASGFVYYVSLKGVTGAASLDVGSVVDKLGQIRSATDLPIGVGFGIKDAESAAQVAKVADAVVVGSAIVKLVGENAGDKEKTEARVTALLTEMRKAIDA